MARQSNTLYPIPPEAREKHTDLLIPLTDGEKEDEYEVELQMQPFLPEAQQTTTSTIEKKPIDKEDDTSSELTEEDMDVLLKGITELEFEHPQLQKKINQRAFSIWSNAQPTRTRETKRKRSKFLSLRPECEATKEQDRQEITKAYKDSLMESSSSGKKPKSVRFDLAKTDRNTQEELELVDDSHPLNPIIEEENPSPSASPTKTSSESPTKTPSASLT